MEDKWLIETKSGQYYRRIGDGVTTNIYHAYRFDREVAEQVAENNGCRAVPAPENGAIIPPPLEYE